MSQEKLFQVALEKKLKAQSDQLGILEELLSLETTNQQLRFKNLELESV